MENDNQKSELRLKTNNSLYYTGIGLFILATIIYFSIKGTKMAEFDIFEPDGLVFINYILACIYFIGTVINSFTENGWKVARIDKRHFSISTALFCISAYTFNLEFDVFAEFSKWTEASLFLMLTPLLALPLYEKLPFIGKWIFAFIIGFGLILSVYFTIYLLPAIPIGLVGLILLGIGGHILTPLFLLLTYIVQFIKLKPTKRETTGLLAGTVTPLIVLIVFSIGWSKAKRDLQYLEMKSAYNSDFPTWYQASRELPEGYFYDLVLRGEHFHISYG